MSMYTKTDAKRAKKAPNPITIAQPAACNTGLELRPQHSCTVLRSLQLAEYMRRFAIYERRFKELYDDKVQHCIDAFVIATCGSYHGNQRPHAGTTMTILCAVNTPFS